ncbi:transposase [Streptomyces sp. NPDC004126]|uniref:transposase n=1 Tax=Streptomyces sp. NPDC004126 TaxID=3390695 RepID=UPI003D00E356
MGGVRVLSAPFVAPGPTGVAVRTRLKGLTGRDEEVLALVGGHLGSLASGDLAVRCRDGLAHSTDTWAARKREVTARSSSRWAGSITKATHDQWAPARRGQTAHLRNLEAARWFLSADGESGKRFGNETIRVAPDGEVSVKLPAPLAHLANGKHGRYVLSCRVTFPHGGTEWADRVEANRAVAYRIHLDVERGRWYLTASWQYPPAPAIPMETALAHGVIGVATNADHLAAWRLDRHGNPIGNPRRFAYQLTGSAGHRDAQVRHALTRLLNWAETCGVKAIAVEDLDFTAEKTREKHGGKRRFRQLISGMPTGRMRARAQGHPIRRRTAPPPARRSDEQGHRTVQARPGALGREETRPRVPGPRTRCDGPGHGVKAGDQCAQHRSGHTAEHGFWQQDSLPLSLQERCNASSQVSTA